MQPPPLVRSSVLLSIYRRLHGRFGPQHWWPADSPAEIAVGAVLTQNTAWTNVETAIANLRARDLLDLHRLCRLSTQQLSPVIRPAGFHNLKARRLLNLVRLLVSSGLLDPGKRRPTPECRRLLLSVSGVGPETADSILLYALNRPSFVIDAYTRRVTYRYGLTRGDESYDELQRLFQANLPRSARLFNEYHALLVRLARTHCRARPDCSACPLA